jgi:carboxymethylenebutenolidase
MDTRDEIADIAVNGQNMGAFLAQPAHAGSWPGVAIAIEGFGVTNHIQSVARRIAAEGYIVLVPDLFHRLGRFATASYTDYDGARKLMHTVSDPEMLTDMNAAFEFLRRQPNWRGDNFGVVGYRVGGRWALVTACHRPDISAVVSYYGNVTSGDMADGNAPAPLELLDSLRAPALLLWGDGEPLTRAETETVRQNFERAGKTCESVTYDGTHRGFDAPEDPYYSAAASQDAWQRTVAWLDRNLRGATAG